MIYVYIYMYTLLHRRISYFPVRHGTTVSLSETGAGFRQNPRRGETTGRAATKYRGSGSLRSLIAFGCRLL